MYMYTHRNHLFGAKITWFCGTGCKSSWHTNWTWHATTMYQTTKIIKHLLGKQAALEIDSPWNKRVRHCFQLSFPFVSFISAKLIPWYQVQNSELKTFPNSKWYQPFLLRYLPLLFILIFKWLPGGSSQLRTDSFVLSAIT
jgi:hypothetical protein